jgi:hypothetical protein
METSQRAALAVLQNRNPSPELGALAELLALIDVLIEIGVIDLPPASWRSLPMVERAADVAAGPSGAKAIDAFFEALEAGNELVAQRMRERARL